jgi:GH15 family glucan-1,4-alpha-glucosidase
VSSAGAEALARVTAPHILREYALLADGERGVLLGPRGDYAWMCFPRWDSDACFASLIGGQGVYAVTPAARFVWGGYYEHGLIWCSRWVTDDGGLIECREALALPSSPDRAVILRRIVVRTGSAKVDVVLDLRAGFGKTPAKRVARADDGTWSAQAGDAHMRWVGAAKAKPRADGHGAKPLVMQLELEEGEVHDLVLVLDAGGDAEPVPDPEHAWSGTEAAWRERLPELPNAVGHRDAQHSYAVLQGLTSAGGGMVAAATMSLPERAREGRNYDYRYVWIRDQCLTGQAVAKAGAYSLMDDAVRFVRERLLEDGPKMVPAYTVTGGAVPDQRTLGLPGYPGGTDVVGNWVNQQFQLDAFGESLLLFAAASGHDHLDADGWRAAETAIAAIEQRWQEPDAGIWELEPDNWTHSRLICAAGLRAIAARQPSEKGAQWVALADAIVAETAAQAVHPDGRWQRSPGDPRVDAALLLPAIRGGIPADDPRTLATLAAVERELTQDGYCYRYRPDERPLGEAEGAFLLCGFLLSLAWAQQGDAVRAARWFERNRTACGPAGLVSEEFDVAERQLRGNLPQAFVHAALLQCAVTQDADSAL